MPGLGIAPGAAAPPPRRAGSRTAAPAVIAAPADVTAARAKAVDELSAIPTVICIARGQIADAGTIQLYWPRFSQEMAKLADTQAEVAKWIDPLIKISPFSGILAVAIPMMMQFGVNHGRVKPGAMGTVSASSISAQMEAEMAKAELAALRVQMEAEREARKIRDEIEKARAETMQPNG